MRYKAFVWGCQVYSVTLSLHQALQFAEC